MQRIGLETTFPGRWARCPRRSGTAPRPVGALVMATSVPGRASEEFGENVSFGESATRQLTAWGTREDTNRGHKCFNTAAGRLRGSRNCVRRDPRSELPRAIRSSRATADRGNTSTTAGGKLGDRVAVAKSRRCSEASAMREVHDLFGSDGWTPSSR
jgi:hypothetical protein